MDSKKLYDNLNSRNLDVPAIAIPEIDWIEQLESFTTSYFANYTASDFDTNSNALPDPTPKSQNFYADLQIPSSTSGTSLKVDYIDCNNINITGYTVEFKLKSKGTPGCLSTYLISFDSITFGVTSIDGQVLLKRNAEVHEIEHYLSTDEERKVHLINLGIDIANVSEVNSFEDNEIRVGELVADGIILNLSESFTVADFGELFKKIVFKGNFAIEDIEIDNKRVICFIADQFFKLPPTNCEVEEVKKRTFVNGSFDSNGNIKVLPRLRPNGQQGKLPQVNTEDSHMFIYLPKKASQVLFSIQTNSTLAATGDFNIFPISVHHEGSWTTNSNIDLEWDQHDPIIRLKVNSNLHVKVDARLRICKRLTVNAGSVDNVFSYDFDYEGKLMEFIEGDLNFVGELYSYKNFSIDKFEFRSMLPDFLDKIFSSCLKFVFEPLLRLLITAVIVTVTWPVMDNYTFNAFMKKLNDWGKGKLFNTKLSSYNTDTKSVLLGFTLKAIDWKDPRG